jgi:anthranilate phosphoribosyltransferase
MMDETKLRAFGRLITRLEGREDLTREEVREAYRQIFRDEQPALHQGAFIAALRTKGETKDEMVGVAESFTEEWSRYFPHVVHAPEPHLGLCGMGMDTLKTVNVTSGAAVIAAACGVYVHKVGSPALTGVSGSSDIFIRWGVDGDVPGEAQVKSTERCRLGFTSLVGRAFMNSGFARLFGQIRMGTSIHVAGPVAVHSGERHKVMGVPDPALVGLVCDVMRGMDYRTGLVPCGEADGYPGRYMDEMSISGPTHVGELMPDGTIARYTVRPADVGLREANYEEVATRATMDDNARLVARALAGKQDGPVLDILLLNAAACLKVMGKAQTLADGVVRARRAVAEGGAIAQLHALIETQSADPRAGLGRLASLLAD